MILYFIVFTVRLVSIWKLDFLTCWEQLDNVIRILPTVTHFLLWKFFSYSGLAFFISSGLKILLETGREMCPCVLRCWDGLFKEILQIGIFPPGCKQLGKVIKILPAVNSFYVFSNWWCIILHLMYTFLIHLSVSFCDNEPLPMG